MISDILYRCPVCGRFDWLSDSGETCTACGADVRVISRSRVAVNGIIRDISAWYDHIRTLGLPRLGDGAVMKSRRVRLAREKIGGHYHGLGGITATHYDRQPVDQGGLALFDDRLHFSGEHAEWTVGFSSITSVTIESDTLIIVSRRDGPLFFDFMEESGKKWEDCLQRALTEFHDPQTIVEFYPKIRFATDFRLRALRTTGHLPLRVAARRWYRRDPWLFYAGVRKVAKALIQCLFRVRVDGLENIPARGAVVLLSNHCSFLDSIILEAFPKRHIWFMAKNSQYKNDALRWFLTIARSFPVRRYTTDVQAVRNAIRVVQQGHILGIFPEGERSWDGRMLPFKRGTLRLALALGVPVIPVGISGAYGLMPRWTSRIRRVPVTIRIGAPLRFDTIAIPRQTEADIRRASAMLREALIRLMD